MRAIHTSLAAALLDAGRAVPDAVTSHTHRHPARRFGVYRNNIVSSLINALRTRFPATEKIVGAEFFSAMAHLFAVNHLPRSPVLMFYGDEFPAFVEHFEPARELVYLPDVVRLEAARTYTHHAADATPLGIEEFRMLNPDEMLNARVSLHPSTQIVPSRYPAVTIWAMNSGERELAPVDLSIPEDALVLRPQLTVFVRSLPRGGAAFFKALASGATIGGAAEHASAEDGAFSLPENLALLLGSGIVTGLATADNLNGQHHD